MSPPVEGLLAGRPASVDVSLARFPGFGEGSGCGEGQAMRAGQVCEVW
ncbi:hypothetical protein G6O69_15285 [Pseudenhygromyxa sp. WMMC2535]|nr:hypothetical protein [Pseudenhygromyxa sp. WMMC2535]NVB39205.1 hypothetical protein [Pseudenhygromyxa sp. WMMC2535]